MMPAIEPFFVRSIRKVVPRLDADLAPTVDAYLAQESQHFSQHLIFNRILCSHYPILTRLDGLMRRTYRRLEDNRSDQFRLAFAAGSEIMAYSAARWAADRRRELFTDADPVASSLFLWHLAEEVEHKSVAHDVYAALHPPGERSRRIQLGAMVVALALVVLFVVTGTTVMLAGARRLHHPIAWLRLIRWSVLFAFEMLTNLALSLSSSFHPSQLVDPAWFEVWLSEFDPESGTLPVWNHQGTVAVEVALGIPTQTATG